MPELTDGCVKPVRGPMLPAPEAAAPAAGAAPSQEVQVLARVGKEAIDFEASAFVAGVGFKPVKLGPRRLRAETAAILFSTLVMEKAGERIQEDPVILDSVYNRLKDMAFDFSQYNGVLLGNAWFPNQWSAW